LFKRATTRISTPAKLLKIDAVAQNGVAYDHRAGRTDAQIEAFLPHRINALGLYAVEKGRRDR
jgi:hypothetical protein